MPLDDRPVSWVVGGHYMALLRKHKSFSRGGTEIEVEGDDLLVLRESDVLAKVA